MGNHFKKMSNKVRDESFSIDLPGSNLVLTRYLYIKDEVKLALLISILNKSDDAIFWAYELYYSGFKLELYEYIWKIYYDFFATLNPCFELYLNKTLKLQTDLLENPKLVSTIVQDLLIRPFNTDIFFLRTICNMFEIECNKVNPQVDITKLAKSTSNLYEQLTNWIDNKDFKSIAQYILNGISFISETENSDTILYKIYGHTIDIFMNINIYNVKLSKNKLLKEFQMAQDRLNNTAYLPNIQYHKRVILLVKILTLISLKEKLVKGKNFYIIVEPEDIIPYDTIEAQSTGIKHYKVLDIARICGIDDLKHLALFKLERDTLGDDEKQVAIKEIYFRKWLYHASFSPLWFNRIKQHRGYVDYKTQSVEFVDEDVLQMFYNKYSYEPDEQSQNTHDKCLKIHKDVNWTTFHDKYKANSLFMLDADELEEINNDKIRY